MSRTRTDARHAAEADTLRGAVRLFYRFPVPALLTIQLAIVLALRLWTGGATAWDLLLVLAVAVWWPVILLLIPIHAALWWVLMPTVALALTGMAAYTAATLLYEWTHYLVHTRYRPRSTYAKTVFRNHRLHHFKNEHYWHAFTVPAIDRWMGTDPDATTVDTSPTVMTLGVDD